MNDIMDIELLATKLKQIEIFSSIDHKSLTEIIKQLEYCKYQSEDRILEVGNEGKGLYILMRGKLKVHQDDFVIAELSEGATFGESALLVHEPVMASVTATTPTEALLLTREYFLELMKSYPALATGILKTMMKRLRSQNDGIRQSELKLRSILQNTSDIISIVSIDGLFQYLSPAVKKILNFDPEELIGTKSIKLFVDDDKDNARNAFLKGLENPGSTTVSEFRFITKEGGEVYLESTSTFLQNDPVINGIIFSSRDITERKRSEELEREKELAIEAGKMKERFLANMSHEIRTPMNAILGMTRLLLRTKVDDVQLQYLNAIFKSSDNLLVIINDILDFSKIESGKLEIENINFDVHDVLENAAGILRFKAQEKGIHLKLEIDKDVPKFLMGDPVRLNQVILNLGGNAVKFTPKGSVTLKVSDKGGAEEDYCNLLIEVVDTGIGIAEDKIASVFESFSQAGSDITRKFGGTGLGLTISKQLVEMQNGTIELKSKLGVGTTFIVNINYKKGVEEKQAEVVEMDAMLIEKLQTKKYY